MSKNKQLTIEYLAIDKLKPFKGNPRKITDADMGKLRKSLREFGFVNPVIVSNKSLEDTIDWTRFAVDMCELLEATNQQYYIKDDLRTFLPKM